MALLDMEESRSMALRARLLQLGHECFVFSGTSQLILALSGGRRFGLLLLVLQDGASLSSLGTACQVLGMPVLVIVSSQWGFPSSQSGGFESIGTLAADVSRMSDEELGWLVRALIQRASTALVAVKTDGAEVWGGYSFYESSRYVRLNGNEIPLQPRQFGFALQLFRNVGRVVERAWLWKLLWPEPALREGNRALDACAYNVRKRLELNSDHGFLLRSVYGQGYELIEVSRIV